MTTLEAGQVAPDFTAKDQHDQLVSLSSFRGKKVILYFYPKDDTPGCTKEACSLRDNHSVLLEKGYVVLGVSPDDTASHQKFIADYQLPFSLIADTDKKVLNLYEAWGEKNMYGKITQGVLRRTFIIDEEGKIVKVFKKVDTAVHANQILDAMEKLDKNKS